MERAILTKKLTKMGDMYVVIVPKALITSQVVHPKQEYEIVFREKAKDELVNALFGFWSRVATSIQKFYGLMAKRLLNQSLCQARNDKS